MRRGKHITEFSKKERKKLAKNNTIIILTEIDKIIEKKLQERKVELGMKDLVLQIIDAEEIKLYPWFSAKLDGVIATLEEKNERFSKHEEKIIKEAKENLSLLQEITKNSIKSCLMTSDDVFKIKFKIVWETNFMSEINLLEMIKKIEEHTNEYKTKKDIRKLYFKKMYEEINIKNLFLPILENFVDEKNSEMEKLEIFMLKELKKIKEEMKLYLSENVTTDPVTFYEERKDILFDDKGFAFIKE
jgi:hypothetical protein